MEQEAAKSKNTIIDMLKTPLGYMSSTVSGVRNSLHRRSAIRKLTESLRYGRAYEHYDSVDNIFDEYKTFNSYKESDAYYDFIQSKERYTPTESIMKNQFYKSMQLRKGGLVAGARHFDESLSGFGKSLSFHPIKALRLLKQDEISARELNSYGKMINKMFIGTNAGQEAVIGESIALTRRSAALLSGKTLIGGIGMKAMIGLDTYMNVSSGKYSVPGALAKSTLTWSTWEASSAFVNGAITATGMGRGVSMAGNIASVASNATTVGEIAEGAIEGTEVATVGGIGGIAAGAASMGLALVLMEGVSALDDVGVFAPIKKQRELRHSNYYKNWFSGQVLQTRATLTTRQRAMAAMQQSYMSSKQFVLGNEASILNAV